MKMCIFGKEYDEKIYEKIVPTKVLKIYKNDKKFMEAYTDFLNQDNLFPISNLRFGDTIFNTQPVKSSRQEQEVVKTFEVFIIRVIVMLIY